jgi:hypothetical protein
VRGVGDILVAGRDRGLTKLGRIPRFPPRYESWPVRPRPGSLRIDHDELVMIRVGIQFVSES